MKKFSPLFWLAVIVTHIGLLGCSKSDDAGTNSADPQWPTRNVNLIVYSSAGGATDLSNRAIAKGMKDQLEIEVVASNMPGAMGGAAVNYVWNQRHNGYQLLGLSEGALAHSVLGLHTSTAKDWEYFMIGGTPGILSVKADSPYQDFASLYEAVKANPDTLTISTSIPGSVWNVQWLNAKQHGQFNARYVPYPGSYPSQTAALSGEVDMVWTGLGEQSEFLKSGGLRPLAVFSDEAFEFKGQNIPPITQFIPQLADVMPLNQFVGFAAPSDTPKDILATLTQAFTKGMQSDAVQQFSQAKYSALLGLSGQQAKEAALHQEKTVVWTLWDAGMAKINPEDLGISRP